MGFSAAFIIAVEFCERIGYYAFQSTQKSFLQDQGFSNASSSSLNQVFALLSYVSCFFGGWLAETALGRYRTIGLLAAAYVLGCFIAAVAALPSTGSMDMYFIGTFVLIAIGTGGIKPNVCTFGADQIDPKQPDAHIKKNRFFLYFYLTINAGCIVAFGFLATTATNGLPPLVPTEDGYFFCYVTAACCMAAALLIFLCGTPWYRPESFSTNSHSVFSECARTLWGGRHHALGKVALIGWALVPFLIAVAVLGAFVESWFVTALSLVLDLVCVMCLCIAHRSNDWLGQNPVAKSLGCVPTLLLGNLVFNVLYNAQASVFYSQSCQMDTRLGSGKDALQLNGAFFNLADSIAIIVFTPVIDRLLLPAAQRLLGRKVTLSMKVYAGILLAISSQFFAAGLEYARQAAPTLDIESKCAALQDDHVHHVHMSGISAFWMAIPYALIGIGEVLINPVLQHCAYEGAHPSMRSLLQAFNLFAMGGMPNAISSALTQATASFTPNNLDQGNLVAVYLINAAWGVLGCIVFWLVTRPTAGNIDSTACSDREPHAVFDAAKAPVILGSSAHHVNAEGVDKVPPDSEPI